MDALLEERFKVASSQIKWIPGDPARKLNLDPLDGVRTDRDVVIVITDYLGHPESEGVEIRCKARGVKMHLVSNQNEVVDYLRNTFGGRSSLYPQG